jgi:hypothetical protein
MQKVIGRQADMQSGSLVGWYTGRLAEKADRKTGIEEGHSSGARVLSS